MISRGIKRISCGCLDNLILFRMKQSSMLIWEPLIWLSTGTLVSYCSCICLDAEVPNWTAKSMDAIRNLRVNGALKFIAIYRSFICICVRLKIRAGNRIRFLVCFSIQSAVKLMCKRFPVVQCVLCSPCPI